VGLGNPGDRYAGTRHNVGFVILDELADQYRIALTQKKHHGLYGKGLVEGKRAALLKPLTYMNRSGRSVAPASRYFGVTTEQVVVIHDDIDLPFGRLRVKWGGSPGGHKGLKSIDGLLGSRDYFRVRVGVGRPEHGNVVAYVLSRFAANEREGLRDVTGGAVEAVRALLCDGLTAAQNRVNGTVYWDGSG
jgi:PTH1 family peptidyl-tRNA hydrolase